MSQFLVGTRTNCDGWLAAIDADAGCPIRGDVVGAEGELDPDTPGPGWTMTVCWPVLEASPEQAVLEVPDDQLHHLGAPGVPPPEEALDLEELPQELLVLVYARRGLDENGNPKPFPFP